ncbi:Hypothetical_protein [Hexamita inflata]|uniref:Hypothetical_protein n=1 Tax=Hexamita inflata TaxID=28002 RepID=A0AA86RDD9_9EUKA|nr:Hypothetical protein HINF_LOCUS58029 [Hexamita inflata]
MSFSAQQQVNRKEPFTIKGEQPCSKKQRTAPALHISTRSSYITSFLLINSFSRFKCSEIPGELVSRFILLVFVVAEVGNNRHGSFRREARWNFSVDIHTGYQQQSMQYDHRLSNARVIECLCDLKQRQSQTLRFCDLQSMYGLLCKQLR